MTEDELRDHLWSLVPGAVRGPQPPFADVAFPLHPDSPVDYEHERATACERVLGACDYVFHPSVGAPHIDVYRYPPAADRPFWCYVTNGMSDFPQVLPDGSLFRSEITCASSKGGRTPAQLLNVLGTMPFRSATFLHLYHTVPFPDGVGDPRFTYTMTVPPFLVGALARLKFLGERLLVMSLIRITEGERQRAVEESSQVVVDSLPDVLDTWLIDGRGGSPLD